MFVLAGLLSCNDDELPLVKDYDNDWQLDVGSQFIENNLRPTVWAFKTVPDGALLILFNKQINQSQLGDYFITKVSSAGQIVKTIDMPAGYMLVDILDDEEEGYTLTMSNDYEQPDFIQLKVSSNLDVSQTSFQFTRPLTFHTLKFSEAGIYRSEFEGTFPGMRVSLFNYDEQLQWSKKYESPFMKPFPYLDRSSLFFFEQNYEDSLTITSVDGSNGEIEWSRSYTSKALFGVENIPMGSGYGISKGIINVSNFDSQSRTFYLTQINPSTGKVTSKRSTMMSDVQSYVLMTITTRDGGYILKTSDTNFTHLFKTDRRGTIGWTGEFLDAGLGRPVENSAGDLYVISDGYVFKLKAMR